MSEDQCDSPTYSPKTHTKDASVSILKDSRVNSQLLSSKGRESLQNSRFSPDKHVTNINFIPKVNNESNNSAYQSSVMVVHQEKTVLSFNSHSQLAFAAHSSCKSISKQSLSPRNARDNRSGDLEHLLSDKPGS